MEVQSVLPADSSHPPQGPEVPLVTFICSSKPPADGRASHLHHVKTQFLSSSAEVADELRWEPDACLGPGSWNNAQCVQ